MQSVLTAKSLDIETTVITNPKLNKNKQLSAGIINSKTKSAVYIETPYLINPFGISSFDGGKAISDDQRTYSLSLKASGGQNENLEEIQMLFNYLKELDEKAIDYGLMHSQQIFKKKYEESQRSILVDLLYNRCVKPSVGQDGTVYPDKITLKVMKDQQNLLKPDVLVFKDSPTPLEIENWDELNKIVLKGTPIKAIMQPRLYFVNGKMGINFRVLQIKLPNFEKVGRPITYAFSETPVESTVPLEQIKALSLTDPSKTTDPTKTTDSEEEVDEEEEEEDEDSEVEVEES